MAVNLPFLLHPLTKVGRLCDLRNWVITNNFRLGRVVIDTSWPHTSNYYSISTVPHQQCQASLPVPINNHITNSAVFPRIREELQESHHPVYSNYPFMGFKSLRCCHRRLGTASSPWHYIDWYQGDTSKFGRSSSPAKIAQNNEGAEWSRSGLPFFLFVFVLSGKVQRISVIFLFASKV